MKYFPRNPVVVLSLAALSTVVLAQTKADLRTKDIVIDSITHAAMAPATAGAANASPVPAVATETMSVSVLLESPDGTLSPKSTNGLFQTGDRFRVKLLASRAGKVSLYNTTPLGQTSPDPVWQGEIQVGQELVTPRLALTGTSGVDQLHVLLEPRQPQNGVLSWLNQWLDSFKKKNANGVINKDIRIDVQNTPTSTYVASSTVGQGIVSTISIVHSAR